MMYRVPVYHIIKQRPLSLDMEPFLEMSVFKPLIGDKCTLILSQVKKVCSPNCNCTCIKCSVWLYEATTDGGTSLIYYPLVIGESDCILDRGLEAVVCSMGQSDIRTFCISCRDVTCCKNGCRIIGTVKLLRVTKNLEAGWRANDKFKLAEAARHKDKGNQLYGKGRYMDAFHRFNKSIKAILFVRDIDSVRETWEDMYAAVCNNMAACQLELGNYEFALQLSSKVLSVNSNNLKALVRQCRASIELRMFDNALTDARRALELDPGNTVAKHYLNVATREVSFQNARYSDIVKKMFA